MSWGQQGSGTWGQQPQQGQGQGWGGQQGQGQGGWGGQQQGNQVFGQPVVGGGWTIIPDKTFDIVQGITSLNGIIPETAREVKFFLDIGSGYNPQEKDVLITISTDQDKCKARVHPYKQDAWSINSQNLSLYLGQKAINAQFEGNVAPFSGLNAGHGFIKLTVLGYR